MTLSYWSLASQLGDCFLCHVAQADHAHCLPNTQSYSRRDASVQALEPTGLIDILHGGPGGQVLWSVGIHCFRLHFDSHHLNGLVPRRESSANGRCQDLFVRIERFSVSFICNLSYRVLCESRQPEPRPPVGALANGYGIHPLVDPPDAFLAENVGKHLKCSWRFQASCCFLGPGDFDGLHARAESHRQVSLGQSAHDSSADSGDKTGEIEQSLGLVLDLR